MSRFINRIHINKLFHLNNLDITIEDENTPHLIITGKNGSGKTILLTAIANHLNKIKDNKGLGFLHYRSTVDYWESELGRASAEKDIAHAKRMFESAKKQYDDVYGSVELTFSNYNWVEQYLNGDFVLAYYKADRYVKMIEQNYVQKPSINKGDVVEKSAADQFIAFLVDLKFQELLAISKHNQNDENGIKNWFSVFENLLREIYQDSNLTLSFIEKPNKYTFEIKTNGKSFGFNEMSDGFKAAITIVADLILKMSFNGMLSDIYKKEGIVLIDEVETHLHLELQKIIMPFLTKTFPNIQFIVTTHSPFVLSSMPNAVAYDLEHREILDDLTNYSYESLAEGYFGVKTPSSYAEMQLNNFQALLEKKDWSDSDKIEAKQLTSDFDKIPETISPLIVGKYRQLTVKYANRIKEL